MATIGLDLVSLENFVSAQLNFQAALNGLSVEHWRDSFVRSNSIDVAKFLASELSLNQQSINDFRIDL